MNKDVIAQIEQKNEAKTSYPTSYWFNPVSFVQNQWNALMSSDHYSYQKIIGIMQQGIDKK